MTDPIYLTEPLIKSEDFILNPNSNQNWLWPCEYVDEAPGREQGYVPAFLPGQNPFLTEFAAKYGIPAQAVLGGPETMYPEYQQKMKGMPIPAKVPVTSVPAR